MPRSTILPPTSRRLLTLAFLALVALLFVVGPLLALLGAYSGGVHQ